MIKDPFIKAVVSQIKSIAAELNINEINELTDYLEEDYNRQEMTIFLNFLNEQLNVIIDECRREEDEVDLEPKKRKSEQIDLDDLVSYIQADDGKRPKKKNRKRKRADKTDIVCNGGVVPDKEIEEFKSNLLINSERANMVRKIKPVISSDWIIKLKQIIV
jgi:hypothetical protein